MAAPKSRTAVRPLYKVRRSKVHGLGVFALRPIKKRTRIVEYLGERISHAVADRRYADHDENDNHTFLFSVDRGLVIDAGVDGNDARFINHACAPNCESVIEHRRVYIEALRDIAPGEELSYDYQIGRERGDPPNVDQIYACRCGATECRGTMLWPPKRPKRRQAKKAGQGSTARPAGGSRSERRTARNPSRSPTATQ
jgi:SET domain-containing protein